MEINYKAFALAAIFLLAKFSLQAQPGCTDPQATNYDPAATENDGSCEYDPTSFSPDLVAELPADLEECSGLAFFDDQLWTHLDGGNLDRIYTLDTLTAEKLLTITIPNADNFDWEDMAEGDEHLYIGDFGNNFGDRTDLRIYKIKKADLTAGTISPEVIEFNFSDQTNFNYPQNGHNFDCEAFFFWGDSLHLFSKNWADFKTRHYVLSPTPGTHTAMLRDSLETQGQITAADITADGTALLLGYNVNTSETFLWLLFDFMGNRFFSGNKRRISMGSAIGLSQPEGLVFRDSTRGYICSEKFSVLPQKLFAFDIRQWVENPVNSSTELNSDVPFSLFPNPAGEYLHIQWEEKGAPEFFDLKITDLTGQVVFSENKIANYTELDISFLGSGKYVVALQREGAFGQFIIMVK